MVSARFATVQAHRGPDQQGMVIGDGDSLAFFPKVDHESRLARLALIHHRLSVIDLSEQGRQPMSTTDGRFHLIYNGEVYNYLELREELRARGVVFVSRSDTEVVLNALIHWGKDALPRFEGMFALALWDAASGTLLLARDYFGIKPLHYHQTCDRFAFASEMKALLQLDGVGKRLDPQATFQFLRHAQTDHGNSTLVREIRQLEPGFWMEVDLNQPGDVRHGRYWKLQTSKIELSAREAAARLRDLFLSNIERHLRSDVTVGTALSGGIDSSAIVSAVRHLRPETELHTFSYVAADDRLSEETWVDIVNTRSGAIAHKITVSADDLLADLDELVDAQDQPFGSTSIYAQFRVFRAAREAGIKVMLDGQGADELFGGYDYFLGARLASLLMRGRFSDVFRFSRAVGKETGLWRLLVNSGPFIFPPSLQAPLRRLVGRESTPRWLSRDWFSRRGASQRKSINPDSTDNIYTDALLNAIGSGLPHLLRYEDRNSMHFSIESRVPFLTSSLAEFAVSMPETYSLSPDGTRKALFRHAMRGIVPDEILDRRDKIGFATPERSWLANLRPWVDSVLESARRFESCPVDLPRLNEEWCALRAGKKRFDSHLWRCLNLIVWTQRNGISMD